MAEWKISFGDQEHSKIYIRELSNTGEVLNQLFLYPPSHAKLYYALKDWFQD